MKVYFESSPLLGLSGSRGIGTYTKYLLQALRDLAQDQKEVDLVVQATHELGDKLVQPAKTFDLMHYPYFDFFFTTLPSKHNLPVVVTIHDVIPLLYPKYYPAGIKGRWRFQKQKRNLANVDVVITDSEASRDGIVEHLEIPESKIRVIPLAGNPQIQPLSDSQARRYAQQLNLPDKYFVYVGDINYNKNLPTLLLALTQLPADYHLCVVSKSFNNTEIPEGQILAKTIAENELEERVHVLDVPKGDNSKLSAILQRSVALVQPSLWEGFGLPVLEAMQAGTVVVSTTGGSLPEVTGEAAILVEPNIAGISQGMEKVIGLAGKERVALIKKGQEWAAGFSWLETARRTWQAYQEAQKQFEQV